VGAPAEARRWQSYDVPFDQVVKKIYGFHRERGVGCFQADAVRVGPEASSRGSTELYTDVLTTMDWGGRPEPVRIPDTVCQRGASDGPGRSSSFQTLAR